MRNQTIGNLALSGFDDIFNSSTAILDGETVVEIPLGELFTPEQHPFQINDDAEMTNLAASVKLNGVRDPGLARPRVGGGYELLCGNRRKRACEIAKKGAMPVIIRELDDDSAAIAMVESNLQHREKILPSERAWSYRIMMEALYHNGVKGESHSYEVVAERTGVKKNQLFRIVRLTELITTLIDKVDAKQLSLNSAVELSYLSVTEQTAVAEAMAALEIKPSLSQAVRLKKLKLDGELTTETINQLLSEEKKPPKGEPTGSARFRKYFPPDYSKKQMEAVIVSLLKDWKLRSVI